MPVATEPPLPRAASPAAPVRRPIAIASPETLATLQARFAAGAGELDRSGAFAFDNIAALHEAGLVAAVVPPAAGGAGATLADARRILAAVARGEPSTALVLTMTWMIHRQIAQPGSRWPLALRDAVWRSAVGQGALANALRVEPELGSSARGGMPATLATRTADGWLISGHKRYTTGIPGLRWLCVWARTDEPEPRVGTFLVPRDPQGHNPGQRVIDSWDHLGLRASNSHELVFDRVAIPAGHAVDVRAPADWAGGPDADNVAWMITLLGTLYDGVARAARDWLLVFLKNRSPGSLGAPLASLPRVQEAVGEIEALLWANEALIDGLVRRTDAGTPPSPAESGLVKFTVTGNAIKAVELALQLTGNHGLSRANPLERHLRDVLCSRIHTPQNDSILSAAGLAAFARA
jgi:alkylation response protein AidB-like acyl-CoA dehydrogenase